MQKLVTVNSTLTPAGKVALAEEVLGIRVADPSTRFNPGTLAGRITSALEAACLVLLSPGKLVALDCGGLSANSNSVMTAISSQGSHSGILFAAVADNGSGRSRALVVDPAAVNIDPAAISSNTADYDELLIRLLMLPETPSWSAAGALSAIFDELGTREPAANFVIALDQFSGRLSVHTFLSAATADAAVVALAALPAAGTVQSAFDLSDPAAPPAGVAGPVWG